MVVKKLLITSLMMMISAFVSAERIKDISQIEGIRSMPLVGYGLVVGLPGTGDGNVKHTQSSLRKMLTTMGVKVDKNEAIKSKNVASVMVSANLPPFSRIGKKMDLIVTSIGDAKSIKDGTLLMTTLKGVDGSVYAIAKGQVVVSGLSTNAQDNSFLSKNRSASGVVTGGGVVERPWEVELSEDGFIRLVLRNPDFTTAQNVSDVINETFGEGSSYAENSLSISIKAPKNNKQITSFVSIVENLDVSPAEASAKVVVNSHTGTVVISKNVYISEALITHGNLIVDIKAEGLPGLEEGQVAQDNAAKGRAFKFKSGVSLNDLVKNINELGVGPSDLIAILQSLRSIGSLRAELIII